MGYRLPMYEYSSEDKTQKGSPYPDAGCFSPHTFNKARLPIWTGTYHLVDTEPDYFKTFQKNERKFIRRIIKCFRPEAEITMDSKTRTVSVDLRKIHSDEFCMLRTMLRNIRRLDNVNMVYDEVFRQTRSRMMALWLGFAIYDLTMLPYPQGYRVNGFKSLEETNFRLALNCGHNVAYGDLMTLDMLKKIRKMDHFIPKHKLCSELKSYTSGYTAIWFPDPNDRPDVYAYYHVCQGPVRVASNHVMNTVPKQPDDTIQSYIDKLVKLTK